MALDNLKVLFTLFLTNEIQNGGCLVILDF